MDNPGTVMTEPEELTESIEIEPMDSDETDEALTLKAVRFVRLLWFRRKMVVTIVLIGIVVSTAYALLLKNVYSSRTTLMPPGGSSSYSSMLGFLANPEAGGLASSALGMGSQGDLYVKILQSRNVQDGLIARFNLKDYFHEDLFEYTRLALEGESTIDSDVKSGVITINVKDHSGAMAADLANGYVAELNRVLTEQSTSSARRERIFLEERLTEVKKDLDDSSKALSQFSTKSKTLSFDDQAKSMVDQGAKMQGDLIEARSELAGLRQTLSPDNQRMKAAEARVNELQRQADAMGGFAGSKQDGTSNYPTAAELPTLGLTYTDLERKVKLDEALWETLTKQYESAKVDEAKELPTVKVLDAATIPERKSAPTRRQILLIGAFFSFIFACLAVIGQEYWNGIDPEDESKKLILEVADYLTGILRKGKKSKKEEAVLE